ncbi:MAG: hypothetical protein RR579_06320 [Eubacterium sp.]
MKYPCLVLERFCKTPIEVTIYGEGLDEDGAPVEHLHISTTCNFQDGAKQVMTAEKQLVTISGVALFTGDIAPELAVISAGSVLIYGEKRSIYKGTKARNPDGTVNYTKLELE